MPEQTEFNSNAWGSRAKWVFAAFVAVGAFFLIAEHRAHVLPFLPWLFLAACPLLHMFMHGGHRGSGGHGGHGGGKRPDTTSEGPEGTKPEGSWDAEPASQDERHQHHGGRS